MPSDGQFRRWQEDQIRVDRFLGKTVEKFTFAEANDDRHERLTIQFTDGTALIVESRITDKESFLVAGARGEDGAPVQKRTVIIE